jgi:subtilisin family serine protease
MGAKDIRRILAAMAFGIALCLALIGFGAGASAGMPAGVPTADQASKIEAAVLRDTADGKSTSAMVLLADQADVNSAYGMQDQDARGWYIYNTLTKHAQRTQASLRASLDAQGVSYRSFWAVNAVEVTVDRALLETLAARSDVSKIESNKPTRWIEDPEIANFSPANDTPDTTEWGVQNVNAPQVWSMGFTGQGIVIGNQDTGMRWTHNALKPKYRGWDGATANHNFNWWDSVHSGGGTCGPNTTAPCDDNGHGTHTTGTTVGDDGAGNQVGVAPGAKWIGCRNMNVGAGTPASYTECFQFFIAPTDLAGQNANPALRPHVMNNSWGCPTTEGCAPTTLQTIVENTQAAGIFVEASNGNDGSACSSVNASGPPAIYGASFSTGAYNIGNVLASFSSRGPVTSDGSNRRKPDISAPGENVRSSTRTSDTSYGNLSGTSMAGPHVVGVVALLWSARPELTRMITETKTILQNTANPTVLVTTGPTTCGGIPITTIPNNHFGYGRVDALAAVNSVPAQGTPTTTATGTLPTVTRTSTAGVPTNTLVATATRTGTSVAATSTRTNTVIGVATNTLVATSTGTSVVGSTSTRTNTVVVVASSTPTCMPGTELVVDGSFEGGSPSSTWTEKSTNFGTPLCNAACGSGGGTAGPRTGDWWSWFGGTSDAEDGAVSQTVNIPAGGATLRFYLWLGAHSDGGTGDFLRVLVGGTEVFRATDADTQYDAGYTLVTVPVTVQGSVILRFEEHNEAGTGVINFSVDDVSLTSGGTCATSVPATNTVVVASATNTTVVATSTTQPATQTPVGSTATIVPTSIATDTAVATATSTACTITFTDVDENNVFYPFIRCLACRGVFGGYSDGTFRPFNDITRGQIAKIVSNAAGFDEDPGAQIYEDVPEGSPFYIWINRLSMRGHIGGYPCGLVEGEPCIEPDNLPYFRPSNSATRGQLAKIVSNAAGLTKTPTGQFYTDVPEGHPFYIWIMRLTNEGVMSGYDCGGDTEPCDDQQRPYFRPYNNVTRGQASKIVANTFYPGCETPARARR